jgi:hypothetical protein
MDEFGETPCYYIWPVGHTEGQPFPVDFDDRLRRALRDVGLYSERA